MLQLWILLQPSLAGQDQMGYQPCSRHRGQDSPQLTHKHWAHQLLPSHSRPCCPRHCPFAWPFAAVPRALLLLQTPPGPKHRCLCALSTQDMLIPCDCPLLSKSLWKSIRFWFFSSPGLYFWHQKAALSITSLHLKSDLQPICC